MNKKGQSILEYTLIGMILVLGVVIMGPYVVRSINAHFKMWDDQVQDSGNEHFTQGAPEDFTGLPGCTCSATAVTGACGGRGKSITCQPTQKYTYKTCTPANCAIVESCVPDASCCTTAQRAECGNVPSTAGADKVYPTVQNCYYGYRKMVNPCTGQMTGCVADTTESDGDANCSALCTGTIPVDPDRNQTMADFCPGTTTGVTASTRITFVNAQTNCNAATKCSVYCKPGYELTSDGLSCQPETPCKTFKITDTAEYTAVSKYARILLTGAGGGGAGSGASTAVGGAGGGGGALVDAYVKLTPGQKYYFGIGANGIGGTRTALNTNGNGTNGGFSWFSDTSINPQNSNLYFSAEGGFGGNGSPSTGGSGGLTTLANGAECFTTYKGGRGGNASNAILGAGGGGGSGGGGPGGFLSGSSSQNGAAGEGDNTKLNGGAGGNGGIASDGHIVNGIRVGGLAGQTPGGGGGGSGMPYAGANGGAGSITICKIDDYEENPDNYCPSTCRNLIANGSFEDPAIWRYVYYSELFNNSRPLPGWELSYGQNIEMQTDQTLYISPIDGYQHIELASNVNSGMRQTVSTIPNDQYELSFYFVPRPWYCSTTCQIEVRWNGTLIDTVSQPTNSPWTKYTYQVMATGTSSTVDFRAAGTTAWGESFGGLIDKVSLTNSVACGICNIDYQVPDKSSVACPMGYAAKACIDTGVGNNHGVTLENNGCTSWEDTGNDGTSGGVLTCNNITRPQCKEYACYVHYAIPSGATGGKHDCSCNNIPPTVPYCYALYAGWIAHTRGDPTPLKIATTAPANTTYAGDFWRMTACDQTSGWDRDMFNVFKIYKKGCDDCSLTSPDPDCRGGLTPGTFNGLFTDPINTTTENSGSFYFTVDYDGITSGWVQYKYTRYQFSGKFIDGVLYNSAGNTAFITVTPGINLSMTINNKLVTGQVIRNDATPFTATLSGGRANNTSKFAGTYTVAMPGGIGLDAAHPAPEGDSIATLTVDAAGAATLSGTLADGTQYSSTTYILDDGSFPVSVSLYVGRGTVYSWLTVHPQDDVTGNFRWIKNAGASTTVYPLGFNYTSTALGSVYTAPAVNKRILNITSGKLSFAGGNLASPLGIDILINPSNTVSESSPVLSSLAFSTGVGTFNGSIARPADNQARPFAGIVLQKQNAGYGYIMDIAPPSTPTKSSSVRLTTASCPTGQTCAFVQYRLLGVSTNRAGVINVTSPWAFNSEKTTLSGTVTGIETSLNDAPTGMRVKYRLTGTTSTRAGIVPTSSPWVYDGATTTLNGTVTGLEMLLEGQPTGQRIKYRLSGTTSTRSGIIAATGPWVYDGASATLGVAGTVTAVEITLE